ncbi:MAG TPA: hypothetical protein VMB50_09345, partial [Myxococcales bacterium]|nr:hypothetical protein [Myxococcales bacterium]
MTRPRTNRAALLGAALIALAWLVYGVATVSEHGMTLDETSIFYAGDRTLFFLTHPGVPGALDFVANHEPTGFTSRFARFPDFADPWHYPVLPGLIMAVTNWLFGARLGSDIDGH